MISLKTSNLVFPGLVSARIHRRLDRQRDQCGSRNEWLRKTEPLLSAVASVYAGIMDW